MTDSLRQETVEVVERSPHTIGATCREVGISRSSYYRWRLLARTQVRVGSRPAWNRIRPREREVILEQALAQPHLSARELCW